jgi:hypothetical protein
LHFNWHLAWLFVYFLIVKIFRNTYEAKLFMFMTRRQATSLKCAVDHMLTLTYIWWEIKNKKSLNYEDWNCKNKIKNYEVFDKYQLHISHISQLHISRIKPKLAKMIGNKNPSNPYKLTKCLTNINYTFLREFLIKSRFVTLSITHIHISQLQF